MQKGLSKKIAVSLLTACTVFSMTNAYAADAVTAEDFSLLENRVTNTEQKMEGLDSKINAVKTDVDDKVGVVANTANDAKAAAEAAKTAVEGMDAKITAAEQKATEASTKVGNLEGKVAGLETAVEGKADTAALNDKADKTALADKADKSVVNDLTAEVGKKATQEDLTALTTEVRKKADASALNDKADKTAVEALEGKVADKADKELGKKVDKNETDIATNRELIEGNTARINSLDTRMDRVGALAVAMAGLHPLEFDPAAPTQFSMAGGSYGGKTAYAAGFFHNPNQDVLLSAGFSICGSEKAGNVGATFRLGRKK